MGIQQQILILQEEACPQQTALGHIGFLFRHQFSCLHIIHLHPAFNTVYQQQIFFLARYQRTQFAGIFCQAHRVPPVFGHIIHSHLRPAIGCVIRAQVQHHLAAGLRKVGHILCRNFLGQVNGLFCPAVKKQLDLTVMQPHRQHPAVPQVGRGILANQGLPLGKQAISSSHIHLRAIGKHFRPLPGHQAGGLQKAVHHIAAAIQEGMHIVNINVL